MLDINFVRENLEAVRAALANRNSPADSLDKFAALDSERRRVITEADALNQARNTSSKEIGALMQAGKRDEAEAKKNEVAGLKEKQIELEKARDAADAEMRELLAGLPNLPADDVPIGADEATMRDALLVSSDAFPGERLTDERVAADLEELRTGMPEGPVGRVVSYVDGRPAATGGWTLVGPVARLWGGATHTELRGHGAYRAVLAERLRLARAAGATLGLSLGRRETSSPILQGLGFTSFGEQREVLLDVSGG